MSTAAIDPNKHGVSGQHFQIVVVATRWYGTVGLVIEGGVLVPILVSANVARLDPPTIETEHIRPRESVRRGIQQGFRTARALASMGGQHMPGIVGCVVNQPGIILVVERAAPEWQATLDALQALPEIGSEVPVGYGGATLVR